MWIRASCHQLKLVATKKGFLGAKETLDSVADNEANAVDLTLREDEKEPNTSQLPMKTLLSSVAEHVRAPLAASPAAPAPVEALRRAQSLLESKDADGARDVLARTLERDPNSASVGLRTLEGLTMLEAGSWWGGTRRLNEAADLNRSLDAKSRSSEPCLALGVVECWRGNPEKAVELFLEGLKIRPESPMLLEELGRAYLLQQNWPQAFHNGLGAASVALWMASAGAAVCEPLASSPRRHAQARPRFLGRRLLAGLPIGAFPKKYSTQSAIRFSRKRVMPG